MLDSLLSTVTAKDVGVLVVAAVTTYFIARDAQRTAKAANRRIDAIIKERDGRDGDRERITRLEEGRKTDRSELLRVRDNAHFAIGSLGAIVGYTGDAIDVVGDALGRELPHPKLVLPRRSGDVDAGGDGA